MSKLRTFWNLATGSRKFVGALGNNGILNWMRDDKYLELLYKEQMGKKLNLKNPVSFNEKLQWLKVNDHNERYFDLVNKIKAKEVVGNIIGKEHIVPIYKIWDKAELISFEDLPDKFVLKCNHDQGSVVLVDDKKTVDISSIRKSYSKLLKRSPYPGTREYPYKMIKPAVFAEKYLGGDIIDYKFYCFNGEPKFLYCGKGLTTDHSLKIDFYDMNWELMPFYRTDYGRLGIIPKPLHFELMKDIAKKLSANTTFVRIDLFEVDNVVYFSEFTLYPASGFMPFVPEEYDTKLGSWINL